MKQVIEIKILNNENAIKKLQSEVDVVSKKIIPPYQEIKTLETNIREAKQILKANADPLTGSDREYLTTYIKKIRNEIRRQYHIIGRAMHSMSWAKTSIKASINSISWKLLEQIDVFDPEIQDKYAAALYDNCELDTTLENLQGAVKYAQAEIESLAKLNRAFKIKQAQLENLNSIEKDLVIHISQLDSEIIDETNKKAYKKSDLDLINNIEEKITSLAAAENKDIAGLSEQISHLESECRKLISGSQTVDDNFKKLKNLIRNNKDTNSTYISTFKQINNAILDTAENADTLKILKNRRDGLQNIQKSTNHLVKFVQNGSNLKSMDHLIIRMLYFICKEYRIMNVDSQKILYRLIISLKASFSVEDTPIFNVDNEKYDFATKIKSFFVNISNEQIIKQIHEIGEDLLVMRVQNNGEFNGAKNHFLGAIKTQLEIIEQKYSTINATNHYSPNFENNKLLEHVRNLKIILHFHKIANAKHKDSQIRSNKFIDILDETEKQINCFSKEKEASKPNTLSFISHVKKNMEAADKIKITDNAAGTKEDAITQAMINNYINDIKTIATNKALIFQCIKENPSVTIELMKKFTPRLEEKIRHYKDNNPESIADESFEQLVQVCHKVFSRLFVILNKFNINHKHSVIIEKLAACIQNGKLPNLALTKDGIFQNSTSMTLGSIIQHCQIDKNWVTSNHSENYSDYSVYKCLEKLARTEKNSSNENKQSINYFQSILNKIAKENNIKPLALETHLINLVKNGDVNDAQYKENQFFISKLKGKAQPCNIYEIIVHTSKASNWVEKDNIHLREDLSNYAKSTKDKVALDSSIGNLSYNEWQNNHYEMIVSIKELLSELPVASDRNSANVCLTKIPELKRDDIYQLLANAGVFLIELETNLLKQTAIEGNSIAILNNEYQNKLIKHAKIIVSSITECDDITKNTPAHKLAMLRCVCVLGETFKELRDESNKFGINYNLKTMTKFRDRLQHSSPIHLAAANIHLYADNKTVHPGSALKIEAATNNNKKTLTLMEITLNEINYLSLLISQDNINNEVKHMACDYLITFIGGVLISALENDSYFVESFRNMTVGDHKTLAFQSVDLKDIRELLEYMKRTRNDLSHSHLSVKQHTNNDSSNSFSNYNFITHHCKGSLQLCWAILTIIDIDGNLKDLEYISKANNLAYFEYYLDLATNLATSDKTIDERILAVSNKLLELINNHGRHHLEDNLLKTLESYLNIKVQTENTKSSQQTISESHSSIISVKSTKPNENVTSKRAKHKSGENKAEDKENLVPRHNQHNIQDNISERLKIFGTFSKKIKASNSAAGNNRNLMISRITTNI